MGGGGAAGVVRGAAGGGGGKFGMLCSWMLGVTEGFQC